MKILFYSIKNFEEPYLHHANTRNYDVTFETQPLSLRTVHLAKGFDAISIFTGDDASASVIQELGKLDVQFIAIRAAGFDNVDLDAAGQKDIQVSNVPEYSPYAIAEHAVALILSLNRKIILANELVHLQNFTLDRLIGFDLHGKTVGVIGTGRIGSVFIKIMHGFGCKIVAYDIQKNQRLTELYDVQYTNLKSLCRQSDIISLHTPLNRATKHLVSSALIKEMKKGVMLINTARGAIVNTENVLAYLENGHIASYGMDVYEKEKGVFFFDRSKLHLDDPALKKLMALPNVLITPHQAFATKEALSNIAATTYDNIDAWASYNLSGNELIAPVNMAK